MSDSWQPKTKIGMMVKEGKIASIEELFMNNYRITEPEIVDYLVPNLQQEVLNIKLVQRQNGDGLVGLGTGKSAQVVMAIERGVSRAKMNLIYVQRGCGSWECACGEPHSLRTVLRGKRGSVEIVLLPGPRGLGLVAGDVAKIILRLAGVKDCWTRSFGETRTPLSMAGAVFDALRRSNTIVLPSMW
jgi:small subunit ribosomal protein S5